MKTALATFVVGCLPLVATTQAPSHEAIYAQARTAADQVPGDLQAWYLLTISEQEALYGSAGAVPDAQQAFRIADQSAATHPNGGRDHEVAMMALTAVAGFGSLSQALDLVHSSQSRPLDSYYGVLLDSPHLRGIVFSLFALVPAVRVSIKQQRRSDPDPKPLPFDPVLLAQDCFARDGSYPAGGMAGLLDPRQATTDASARAAIGREVLAHIGGVSNDGVDLRDAVGALGIIHGRVPGLDADLMKEIPSLLRRLAANGSPDVAFAGSQLLQIATEIDPHRGAELEAEYPQLRFASHAGVFPPPPSPPSNPDGDLASAGAISPSSPAEVAQQAELLAEASLQFAPTDPVRALQAARQFAGVITVSALAQGTEKLLRNSALLAQALALRLNQRAMGDALMTQCLDAAELRAQAAQQDFDRAAPAERPAVFEKEVAYPRTGTQYFKAAAEIFGLAAQMDPHLAWQRASACESPLFKPLFLLRSAMTSDPALRP